MSGWRFRGSCSCGWRGAWRIDPNLADMTCESHLYRMWEVLKSCERHDVSVEDKEVVR